MSVCRHEMQDFEMGWADMDNSLHKNLINSLLLIHFQVFFLIFSPHLDDLVAKKIRLTL